jgi:glyoxylase-like metal-dependent hydrolase (beta-lactamase superfamily II)
MSYYIEGMIFTGDVLFIRGTGRTDFQQGSPEKMYHSIHQKIFILPDDTKIFPGHDYKGLPYSTVGLEKKYNPRIGGEKSFEDFKKIMSELKLAPPKKINEAVPANLHCGAKPA